MTISIDNSDTSAIALCSCGWRVIRLTRSAAVAAGVEHEREWHPETGRVAATRRQRAARARKA